MNKNVTILNFSPRKDGNCSKIANYISEYYKRTNVRLFHITAEIFQPCHDCGYECLTPGTECPAKDEYQTQIMDACRCSDVVYFFCGYPNANYFAFNERSVGYFSGDRSMLDQYMSVRKRFIIVSNSQSENFRNAMRQQTNEDPKILYMRSGK